MKNYDIIEKMNRAVYDASNSRKTLKKLKKYCKAKGYNIWWNSDTEVLEICPGDKSVVADWDYVITVMYRADYGYKIAGVDCSYKYIDNYCGVADIDMMNLFNAVEDAITLNSVKLGSEK